MTAPRDELPQPSPSRRVGADTDGSRPSIRVLRTIEWADTDASGHWHNTAAFRLIEVAERVLISSVGLHDVYGQMPRVHISADFLKPLRFNEVAEIELTVAEVGRTSVTYRADISRDGDLCARLRFVAVLRDENGRPTSWSDDQRRRLSECLSNEDARDV